MKNYLLIILFTFILKPELSNAFNKNLLLSQLAMSNEDTSKLFILYSLIENNKSDTNFATYNSQMSLLAQKLIKAGSPLVKSTARKYYAASLFNIGILFQRQNNIPSALEYFQKSLALRKEIGEKNEILNCLYMIRYIYRDFGDYSKALDYYYECLKLQEEGTDSKAIAQSLNDVGEIYYSNSNNLKAVEFYRRSLKLSKEAGLKSGVIESLLNLGYLYLGKKDYSNAIKLGQEALNFSKEFSYSGKIREALHLLKRIVKEQHSFFSGVFFINHKIGVVAGQGNASTDGIIQTTVDGGVSWNNFRGIGSGIQEIFFTDNKNGIAVLNNGLIQKTSDGGLSWNEEPCTPGTNGLMDVCFPTVTTGFAVGANGTILKKNNTNWVKLNSSTNAYLVGVSFSDSLHGIAVGGDYYSGPGIILQTSDGGLAWNIRNRGSLFLSGVALNGNNGIAVGFAGTTLSTNDGGVTWTEHKSGAVANLNEVSFSDSQHATAVGWFGTVIHSKNGGITWTNQYSGTKFNLNAVCFTDPDYGIAVGDGGIIIRTVNRGETWSAINKTSNLNLSDLEKYESDLEISDSISNEAIRKSAIKQQLQFEFEKKEAVLLANQEKQKALANEEKAKQKIILNSIGGGVLIVSSSALLLFFSYRRKQKAVMQNKITDSRLRAINAQMNPHFIFNCMHTVQTMINRKDFHGADNCLVRFAKLIRRVLDNSTKIEIPLEEEIETLCNYVELEKLHLEYPMEFEVRVDDNLKPEEIYVPPLIIQPFVENAIVHGLKPKKAAGKVIVDIRKKIDTLVIEIVDNGIGRRRNNLLYDSNNSNKDGRKSYGEPLAKERLEYLSGSRKLKTGINIDDVYDAENKLSGTKVTLTVPL